MPIPITSLRSSMFGTHKLCGAKFALEYSMGWGVGHGYANKKADKGTIFHKIMEILAYVSKNNGKYYDEETNIDINVDDVWMCDIRQLIDSVYYHHTNIMNYHEWEDKDLEDIRSWIDDTLKMNNGIFDPRNRKVIAPEQRFSFEIERPWAMYKDKDGTNKFLILNGTIDLITEVSPKIYEIIDWKTSERRTDFATNEEKDHKYFKNDIQLRIYHYAASRLYPDIEQVILTINYVRAGGAFTIHFDKSELEKTEELIREKYEEIRDTIRPSFLKEERPQDNWKCKYVCAHSRESFSGIPPIIETRPNQITKIGEPMARCECLRYFLEHRTIEQIIENMTKEGFKEGGYSQGLKNE